MRYRSLPSSEGCQVKNDEKLQSGTQENNWKGGANFKKGHVFGHEDTLTNANFSFGEKSFTKKLNEDQKINKYKRSCFFGNDISYTWPANILI